MSYPFVERLIGAFAENFSIRLFSGLKMISKINCASIDTILMIIDVIPVAVELHRSDHRRKNWSF